MKKMKIKKTKFKPRARRGRKKAPRAAHAAAQKVDLFGEPIRDTYFEPLYLPDSPPVAWGKYSPYGE